MIKMNLKNKPQNLLILVKDVFNQQKMQTHQIILVMLLDTLLINLQNIPLSRIVTKCQLVLIQIRNL